MGNAKEQTSRNVKKANTTNKESSLASPILRQNKTSEVHINTCVFFFLPQVFWIHSLNPRQHLTRTGAK